VALFFYQTDRHTYLHLHKKAYKNHLSYTSTHAVLPSSIPRSAMPPCRCSSRPQPPPSAPAASRGAWREWRRNGRRPSRSRPGASRRARFSARA
jgi:hypothetical protein